MAPVTDSEEPCGGSHPAISGQGAGSLSSRRGCSNPDPRDGTRHQHVGQASPSQPASRLLGLVGRRSAHQIHDRRCRRRRRAFSSTQRRRKPGANYFGKPMSFAASSPSADTGVYPLLLNNMFGAKLKLVTGYQGGADMTLALERGEVDGRCGWSLAGMEIARPTWLKDGQINIPDPARPARQPRGLTGVPLDHGHGERRAAAPDLTGCIVGRPGLGLCVCRAARHAGQPDQSPADRVRPDHEDPTSSPRQSGRHQGPMDRERR